MGWYCYQDKEDGMWYVDDDGRMFGPFATEKKMNKFLKKNGWV